MPISSGLADMLAYLADCHRTSEEAIPERDPLYCLPVDSETLVDVPWGEVEDGVWRLMTMVRPALRCLEEEVK